MSERVSEPSMLNLWNMWLTELHEGGAGLTLKIKQVLYSEHSDFQRVDVVDTEVYGKALVLYGSIMMTERDHFIYSEMIAHVPLLAHPNPKNALVIGGGDGGTLTQMVKHPSLERADMVEIDPKVVEVCREYFPELAAGYNDPRATAVFEDGAKYVAETDIKYDVIMADTSDPVGPAEVLFQREFYQNIHDCLSDDGIFVAQSESPFYHLDSVPQIYRNLRAVFPFVRMYTATVPTYPSGIWSFAFCSKQHNPFEHFDSARAAAIPGLRYYNADIHSAAFALPNYMKELIAP